LFFLVASKIFGEFVDAQAKSCKTGILYEGLERQNMITQEGYQHIATY